MEDSQAAVVKDSQIVVVEDNLTVYYVLEDILDMEEAVLNIVLE